VRSRRPSAPVGRDRNVNAERILAFAYACDPQAGSEPGAGWAWARLLARIGETWVITRCNNRSAIEAELRAVPEAGRLHFVYVDLPRWSRFWKRGQRGVRLYYFLWQLSALRVARRLNSRRPFTVVWHLTFANAWLGSVAPLVGPPLVYGPVGGGLGVPPRSLLFTLGPRTVVYELGRAAARAAGRYLNPLARLAWRRAALILVQNEETRSWLPRRYRHRAVLFPNPLLDAPLRYGHPRRDPPTALYAGRLLDVKGVGLAIRAVATQPPWRLVVCGAGRDEPRLRRLVEHLDLADRVEFIGTRTHAEVLALMQEVADVLLFPSVREEAGWVVVEALASGLPVICLDRGAPRVLAAEAGLPAPTHGHVDAVVAALGRSLARETFPSHALIRDRARYFSTERTLARLSELLLGANLLSVTSERSL
jgi:glycosyltransferase involved in cell wall biosynthesis